MSDSIFNNSWGLPVPQDMTKKIKATWGARAIYTRQEIDLLPDRQSMHVPGLDPGKTTEWLAATTEFIRWINTRGLPYLRKQAPSLYPDETRVVSLNDGNFHIEASPNASHGYLYIRAWEAKDGAL